MNTEDIARVCHEVNRAIQQTLGEPVNEEWNDTDERLQESAIDGVVNAIEGASPREMHESWLRFKENDGWAYGPVKDFEKKEHPCFVPYDELPTDQQIKDAVFAAIVRELYESE